MGGSRSTRGARSGLRLLLLPGLVLVVLVGAVHLLGGDRRGEADPAMAVDRGRDAPDPMVRVCARDGEAEAVASVRAALGDEPTVSSTAVIACPAAFDGLRVRYVGELVGDLLSRDGGSWVLVNDDDYALEVGPLPRHGVRRGTNTGLTVWLPTEFAEQVDRLGRPGRRGEVVAIEGRVLRADPADGGGLTLRAEHMERLAPAVTVDEPLDVAQLWAAIALAALSFGLWAIRRHTQRS